MTSPFSSTLRAATREEGLGAGLQLLEARYIDVRPTGGRTLRFGSSGPSILLSGEPRATERIRPEEGFFRDLLEIRLGLSESLLRKVIEHLRRRPSGETTILLQQLVKAQLADIAIGHLEISAAVSTALLHPRRVRHLDRQITDLDRSILRLFGGWGYLHGEVPDGANVSEQLLSLFDAGEERRS